MRSRLSLLCLLPLLVIGCSTVKVAPAPKPTAPGPAVRVDKANAQDFPAGESDGYRPPARLAVLLPMTGTSAPAAAGVRDGFLAAYYAESRRRPVVKFYNTLGTGSGAQAALAKAVEEGAQMIVGPLTRDEVNAVYEQANTGMPLITLNRGSRLPPPRTSSFALLPDDEGTAVANRLANRGLKSVLVFSNRSDNAQRAVAAFGETLRKRGGTLVAELTVSGSMSDLGPQLAALSKGPTPPDAVFIALEAGPARTVAAQLKASVARRPAQDRDFADPQRRECQVRYRTDRDRISRDALAARPGRRSAGRRRIGQETPQRARSVPAPVRFRRRCLEIDRLLPAPV